MQIRMQSRLRYRVDCDPSLPELALPPLLIQPLIENAIHHGLEPRIEGGELVVRAWRDGADLVIDVEDDGPGLVAPPRLRRKVMASRWPTSANGCRPAGARAPASSLKPAPRC